MILNPVFTRMQYNYKCVCRAQDYCGVCEMIKDILKSDNYTDYYTLKQNLKEKINIYLKNINHIDSRILVYRYGLDTGRGMIFKELPRLFALSQNRIYMRCMRALRALRREIKIEVI